MLAAASGGAALAVSAASGSSPQIVTLGNASGEPNSNICSGIDCTYVPYAGASDPELQVPFDGIVTSFSVNAGSTGGQVELRVLRPAAGEQFTAVGTSPAETLSVTGINTFSVSLPVEQGDVLALDNESSALVFEASTGAASTHYFDPGLAEGATKTPSADAPDRLLLSAEVQVPPPTAAGQLYAFGDNYYGQLGSTANNKTEEPNPTPALVTLPGATGPVTQAAAGRGHSLAVTSTGQLYAFGDNYYGQLGSTANNKTEEPNPTPALVRLPGATGPVTQVAAGAYYSLAVTSTGQLYAFGENKDGQLGSTANNKTEEPNPTPALVTLPGATGPVTQAAAGYANSLVVTSTGQLYAFGENFDGQLGSAANNEPNPTPALVTLPGATGPVTQAAAGGEHSLAVTSTGQLYAFGYNRYGQLGSTAHNNTGEPNPTPAPVTLPGATGPVTQVAAGAEHSLAVTSTGQLYAFGENGSGQLGSAVKNEPNPTPALVTLPGATGAVTQAVAGEKDSLAVTSTGQLYAFGENYYGQLGSTANNRTGGPNPTPALVSLPTGSTIDTVARGPEASETLALVADLAVTSGSLPAAQVGVSYSTSAYAAGGITPYSWSATGLPAGLSINAASGQITGTPTSAGSANVTLTVTDAYGIIASSAVIALTVAPAPTPLGHAITQATTRPPTLTSVSLTHTRFRVAKQATAISAKKTPLGTTFRFTLSAGAKLQITITRTAAGLRHGHSCLAPTAKLKRTHAKRCTRTLTVGTLTRASEPHGADSLPFSGRIGHRALSPQLYKAALSATDAGGRSKTVTLSFTVVH